VSSAVRRRLPVWLLPRSLSNQFHHAAEQACRSTSAPCQNRDKVRWRNTWPAQQTSLDKLPQLFNVLNGDMSARCGACPVRADQPFWALSSARRGREQSAHFALAASRGQRKNIGWQQPCCCEESCRFNLARCRFAVTSPSTPRVNHRLTRLLKQPANGLSCPAAEERSPTSNALGGHRRDHLRRRGKARLK
jgi:hypothetical protein